MAFCLNFQVGFGSGYFEPINGYDMRTLNGMIFKGIDAQIRLPGYYKVREKTTSNLIIIINAIIISLGIVLSPI